MNTEECSVKGGNILCEEMSAASVCGSWFCPRRVHEAGFLEAVTGEFRPGRGAAFEERPEVLGGCGGTGETAAHAYDCDGLDIWGGRHGCCGLLLVWC